MNNIEMVALIYKSTNYLNFIINEFRKDFCKVDGWEVKFRLIANDATEGVLATLANSGVPYTILNNPNPQEYYLNRVYRAWNFGATTSGAENICFVNSDDVFSKDWLKNLLKHHNGINIPVSRLIESGKMPSGTYGITQYFGNSPASINFDAWNTFVNNTTENRTEPGGLFMPVVFNVEQFKNSGMFPEGNIYNDGVGTLNGPVIQSGDAYFYKKLETDFGMKHITVFDSLIYHIQEGEMDE